MKKQAVQGSPTGTREVSRAMNRYGARLIRRCKSPVAFVTLAQFLWSLGAFGVFAPRVARADESETLPVAPVEVGEKPVAAEPSTLDHPAHPSDGSSMAAVGPTVPKPPADETATLGESTGTGAPLDDPKSLPVGGQKSGASSQATSVPQGAGKIQGLGESFSTDLSTGVATYSVPILQPPARGGAQPGLGLSYNSGGGHGAAGVGWSFGVKSIARKLDRGIPQYDDRARWHPNQDRFVTPGGDLVPICLVEGGLCVGALPSEVMPAWANGWQYFRPAVEGTFERYFWSPDHRTWRVQSKAGTTAEYGVPLDGSGYAGALESDPSDGRRLYRWSVVREYDAQRGVDGNPVNLVQYRYLSVGGSTYLSDVYDTPPRASASTALLTTYAHHTRVRWEARTDPKFSFNRGWRVTDTMRVAGIDVTSKSFQGGADALRELLRRYHLTYDANAHVSLLQQVTLEGRCAAATAEDALGQLPSSSCPKMPPLRFDYEHVAGFDTKGSPAGADLVGYEAFDDRIHAVGNSPLHSVDEDVADFFDLNADGLPDLLVTAPGLYGGDHGAYYNGFGGKLDTFSSAKMVPVLGVGTDDATTISLKNLNVSPMDVDGDGNADLVHMPKVKTYSVYSAIKTGPSRFDYAWQGRSVSSTSLSPVVDLGKDAAEIRVMDVNGDGLVDLVRSTGTEFQTFLALGRYPGGDGQFGSAQLSSSTTAAISNEPIRRCVPWAGTPVKLSDGEIHIADMNGDGLPDLVKVQKTNIQYWPGRGDGTWGTGDIGSCTAGTYSTGTSIAMTDSPAFTEPVAAALRLDDVNGDGLDDLVQVRIDGVDTWLNVDGMGWTARHIAAGTPPAPSYASRVRLLDMNGSGSRDIVWANGLDYRYIDPLGGQRPWVLTKVTNGLGATTELEYSTSTALMLAAEPTQPWTRTAPTPVHVIVRSTTRDNLGSVGRSEGVYVTEYSYRNPVYDGVRRAFRGFEEASTRRIGDANSPTSVRRTTFLLGECVKPKSAVVDPCSFSGRWADNPREGLRGLELLKEDGDDSGSWSNTTHHTYVQRVLYKGLDGRAVRFAYETASDVFAYETAPFTAGTASVSLDRLVGDESESETITLRAAASVRTRMESAVDDFGNPFAETDRGCISGCGGLSDEAITVSVSSGRPAGDTSGWLFRKLDRYVSGSSPSKRHRQSSEFDAKGNLIARHAILEGSIPLDRFHEDPDAGVAPSPDTAVADGDIVIHRESHDELGNIVFTTGPNGHCNAINYDSTYGQLVVGEDTYVGRPLTTSTPVGSISCGERVLHGTASYDRGFGAILSATSVHGEVIGITIDGFGRLTSSIKPDPDPTKVGTLSSAPALLVSYELPDATGGPFSRIRTRYLEGDAYRESWKFVDGLGRTLAVLTPANDSDPGPWILSGAADWDAKGNARRAFAPVFYSGPVDAAALSLPGGLSTTARYDAYDRLLERVGFDGQRTLATVHHPLSEDGWDAADLTPGPHAGTPFTTRLDGHGRIVASVERVRVAGALEERETRFKYLPTGEVVSVTRVHGGLVDDAVVRWNRWDSQGRLVAVAEPNATKGFTSNPSADLATMKTWRYVYNAAGDLVGTSDARGCGTNYHYDAAGRLVAEDYSPCLRSHAAYSAPDFTYGAERGLEVLHRYDAASPDLSGLAAAAPGCHINDLYRGRLSEVADRAARTITSYDGRGRVVCVARQIAKPGAPADELAARYSTDWFVRTATYDTADRAVEESTGASAAGLLGGDGQSLVKNLYDKRGLASIDSSYGPLVRSFTRDADQQVLAITYGDAAHTATAFGYDDRRRLRTVQTYRGPPALWTPSGSTDYAPTPLYGASSPTSFQLVLQDLEYQYDVVDNPLVIRDWRKPEEWPAGARPVTRKLDYDDLNRVTSIAYQYPGGSDDWTSPFAAENAATAGTLDPRLSKPSPHVRFAKRTLNQTFTYDWLGNIVRSDDDAHGFYDRSLGTQTHGTSTSGPYQLKSASNAGSSGGHTGTLSTQFDDGGNLVALVVRRAGECLPTGATCNQRFDYEWDEVGRLARARRWDLADPGPASSLAPTTTPDVELKYAYDGADNRILKTAVDSAGAERHTLYVFESLEVRRTTFAPETNRYRRDEYTEVPRLAGIGRVAYEDADVPSVGALHPRLHVFIELDDHLGSTSIVIDKDTSELVEAGTYLALGASESDYRPSRWKAFREDNRFTGKEEDVEVGLTYFGARYLSSYLGRWISFDPATLHASAADPNGYAYVSGRLLSATDPLGLWGEAKSSNAQVLESSKVGPDIEIKTTEYGANGQIYHYWHTYDVNGDLTGAHLERDTALEGARDGVVYGKGATFVSGADQALAADDGCYKNCAVERAQQNGAIDFVGGVMKSAGNVLPAAAGEFVDHAVDKVLDPLKAPEPLSAYGKQVYDTEKSSVETALTVSSVVVPEFAGEMVAGWRAGEAMSQTAAPKPSGCPAGSCNCFVAGTHVWTEFGFQPIESLMAGDRVWTREDDGTPALRTVEETYIRFAEVLRVDVKGDLGAESFLVTSEHPFYSIARGWVAAGALRVDERIARAYGDPGVVSAVEPTRRSEWVYNLKVEGAHNYFVGQARLLVHNANYSPRPGRLGNAATREHIDMVATAMEKRGWKITGGGGRLPEEYLPGPGGARKGSSFPDITATKGTVTLRVNTVDTMADGVTMTPRERANAIRIRQQTGEHVLAIPKPKPMKE